MAGQPFLGSGALKLRVVRDPIWHSEQRKRISLGTPGPGDWMLFNIPRSWGRWHHEVYRTHTQGPTEAWEVQRGLPQTQPWDGWCFLPAKLGPTSEVFWGYLPEKSYKPTYNWGGTTLNISLLARKDSDDHWQSLMIISKTTIFAVRGLVDMVFSFRSISNEHSSNPQKVMCGPATIQLLNP